MSQLQLSAGLLPGAEDRVPSAVADLAGSENVQPAHLAEAMHLRPAAETILGAAKVYGR